MTFFSGTDIATLKSEGNDNNHFVSLIINNAGVYSAAITRKVNSIAQGTEVISYNSFNDEHIEDTSMNFTRENSYIEYYPLTITMPEVTPKSELEIRLEEVRKNARSYINRKYTSTPSYPFSHPAIIPPNTKTISGIDRVQAINAEAKEIRMDEPKQLQMFSDKEMGKAEEDIEENLNIPYDEVHVNQEVVLNSITQIITGDLFSIYKQGIDLDKWANNMENLYNKRFGDPENENFKYWVDSMLDFLVSEVHDDKLIEQGEDFMWAIWAYDVLVELEKFPKNKYLEEFSKSINRWLI